MTTPNRFQAVLAAVRAGDDQARRDAETARARRADHLITWWHGMPTRPITPWVATKYVSDVTAEWRQAHGFRVPIYAHRED